MNPRALSLRPVAAAAATVAASLCLMPALAQAQQAAAASGAAAGDGLKLDSVVITGTSTARTKMKQSVSLSTLDGDSLQNTVAASATDVLRTVPGLRAESSGGEGNANLGVRGLPMSDGGGRYVQLQEDGLPVLLIGDMSFATADQFVRADFMTDGVDVIRGGSSSTLATNAPGAIVNFRSKTGKAAGGALGFSTGLDHRQMRLDFAYGGKLGDGLTFQMGGFYRHGEGPRNTDVTLENGGQFRANLTKDLGQGSYLRVNFKSLHDKTPTYLPVPVVANGSRIETIAGVDPRQAFFVNSKFASDVVVDKNGNRVATNPADGLQVKVDSIGLEGQFNLGGGLQITERFRKSAISGRFIGVFPAGSQPADYAGTAKVFSAHIFNTSLDDMGNVFNDLRISKELALAAGSKLTLVGGLFNGQQNVGQTWYWNRYNIGLGGDGAGVYNNAGAASTGAVGDATTTWGGCCFRNIDVRVTATAPYAALTFEQGPLSIDASVRHDRQQGSGTQKFGSATTGTWNPARLNAIGWRSDATSYSVGANYELQRNLALFARASHGASWKSPDRVVWDLDVDSGKAPYPLNEIDQVEAGVKYRGQGFSAFVTAFFAKTREGAGYELTTQTVKNNSYESKGIEAEFSTQIGPVRLIGGATLTDAQITSGSNMGKTPRRQARLVYQLSPSYVIGPVELGASIVGTTKSHAQDDNVVVLPGYATVNTYLNYELRENLTLQLGVNNLFNTLAYTEAEGQNNLGTNPLYIARAINGRSAKLAVRYSF
ncbi:TonB-dependent receptor domain-containing protein [Aquabacterium sp. OR-4]|uniref:TonB-dependent receptor domain-containing protein n=1 Tax=Aquabacterium sp. OR-4 TaxID=2978127 RepID=UPI0028C61EB4|nr:TonB-dependent receptor [Aquabacterium sp. OR-4]MDT7838452.1 TonB-dependent receptor [Aquabacterium sp. OR-4]